MTRRILLLLLVLATSLAPGFSSAVEPTLTYEAGQIVLERSGPLDPVPSQPCTSEASTPEGAGLCATAPGCLVAADPLLGAQLPEDPPCRLAISFDLSGHVSGAVGTVTLEMQGEISSASGLVLVENINLLYGGTFDVQVAPDGSFSATLGPIDWRTWGPGPTCSNFMLFWVKVHDPDEPLGVPPKDPGPGAAATRCG